MDNNSQQPNALNTQTVVSDVEKNISYQQEPIVPQPNNESQQSLSLAKVSEGILFGLAIVVVISFIFSLNILGLFGVGAFFVYGIIMLFISMLRTLIARANKKDYIGLTILLILGIIMFPILGYAALIGYFIIGLMLGFIEPINS